MKFSRPLILSPEAPRRGLQWLVTKAKGSILVDRLRDCDASRTEREKSPAAAIANVAVRSFRATVNYVRKRIAGRKDLNLAALALKPPTP